MNQARQFVPHLLLLITVMYCLYALQILRWWWSLMANQSAEIL